MFNYIVRDVFSSSTVPTGWYTEFDLLHPFDSSVGVPSIVEGKILWWIPQISRMKSGIFMGIFTTDFSIMNNPFVSKTIQIKGTTP